MHKKNKLHPLPASAKVDVKQKIGQLDSDLLIQESKAEEAALDEALWETFPASDPIAICITPVEKVLCDRHEVIP
ncbi:hypothetical protein ACO0KY_08535 [Undibacterium sp. Dicai25W]|uniref:hypothetical protein n=1 Tax=Undibacterium sp. Dicai25W TaxID=3413034 RepID=UPI003BF3C422